MLSLNLSKLRTQQAGFTIVELLIVIIVIGILTAITIVAYNGISQQAIAASLQSDLKGAATQLKLYQIDNGNYPTSNDCSTGATPAPPKICLKASSGNTLTAYAANNATMPQSFTLNAVRGTVQYIISDNSVPVLVVNNATWTPAKGMMPVWWIDASQLTGLSDGAAHYKTNVVNSQPVVRFVSSNGEALRAYPNSGGAYDPMSAFVVGKMNGGVKARLFGGIYPARSNYLIGWHGGNENVMYGGGWVADPGVGGSAGTNLKVYSLVQTVTFSSFYNVGNLIAANSGATSSINGGVALSGYDGAGATSELSDGDIAEVIIYSSALSSTDRQRVEGYLAWKYGTQSQLPAGHPYAAAAPTIASGP